MLPRSQRLRATGDFRRVYARGRSYVHPLIVLYVLPVEGCGRQIGFSVSKKLGGAVDRNRFKRRLREAARGLFAETLPGFDAVVVARTRMQGASYQEIADALREGFRRAGRIGRKPEAERQTCDGSVSV